MLASWGSSTWMAAGGPPLQLVGRACRTWRSHAARRQAQHRARDAAERGLRKLHGGGPANRELLAREAAARPALRRLVEGLPPRGEQTLRRNVAWHAHSLPSREASSAAWRAAQRGPRLEARREAVSNLYRPLPPGVEARRCVELEVVMALAASAARPRPLRFFDDFGGSAQAQRGPQSAASEEEDDPDEKEDADERELEEILGDGVREDHGHVNHKHIQQDAGRGD